MNEDIAKEILDKLFSSLEELETQNAAVLQLLKDKGLASEHELAAHLEQAGNASNVKWRAARVRIDHLISSAIKAAEREAEEEPKKEAEKESAKAKDNRQEFPPSPDGETSHLDQGAPDQGANRGKGKQPSAPSTNSKANGSSASPQKNQSQPTEGAENEKEKTGREGAKNAA